MVEVPSAGETGRELGSYSVVSVIRVITREGSPQEDSARAAHD